MTVEDDSKESIIEENMKTISLKCYKQLHKNKNIGLHVKITASTMYYVMLQSQPVYKKNDTVAGRLHIPTRAHLPSTKKKFFTIHSSMGWITN